MMSTTPHPPIQERDQLLLEQVVVLISEATERYRQDDSDGDTLPSSSELAKQLNVKLDHLKKKMRILKEYGLIQAASFSPKRYRMDPFAWQALQETVEDHDETDHPLAFLILGASLSESEDEGDDADQARSNGRNNRRRRR